MGSLNTESTPVWRLKPHSGKGNGFIYVSITWVMFLLNGLNLMQGFKAIAWLSAWKNGKWDSQRYRKNANTAVDIYTILKWAIVLGIWYWKGNGGFCTFIVWYLLIANLHTFVYYFLFKPDPDPDFDRSRKRFIKLGMAFIFFDLCFAWLYSHPYYRDFHWPADPHHGWQAFGIAWPIPWPPISALSNHSQSGVRY